MGQAVTACEVSRFGGCPEYTKVLVGPQAVLPGRYRVLMYVPLPVWCGIAERNLP